MSKRINVNPDHYKVAGRERQGEDIVHGFAKQAYAQQQAHAERWQARPNAGSTPQKEAVEIPVERLQPPTKPSRRSAAKAKAARRKPVPRRTKRKASARKPRGTTRRRKS